MSHLRNTFTALLLLSIFVGGCSPYIWYDSSSNISESYRTKNYYTYLLDSTEVDDPGYGLIVGEIDVNAYSLIKDAPMRYEYMREESRDNDFLNSYYNNVGSVFNIERIDGESATPVNLNITFRKQRKYAVIPYGFKISDTKTYDVFAGNIPKTRKQDFKPLLGGSASYVQQYLLPDGAIKIHRAYHSQFPKGWFVLRLPEGRYRITNIGAEVRSTYEDDNPGAYYSTVTTENYTVNIPIGFEFTVANGEISYAGSHLYTYHTNGTATHSRLPDQLSLAREITEAEFDRLKVPTDKRWRLIAQ